MAKTMIPDRGDDPKRKFTPGNNKPMTKKQYSDWNDQIALKYPNTSAMGAPLNQAKGKDRY